jgi:ribose transport system permease protein
MNGTDAVNAEPGVTATNPEESGSGGEGGRPKSSGVDWLSELLLVPWIGVLAGLIIISAGISFLTPYFLTWNNILGTVALYFSWICITGFGAGLVMIGGGLDLSVGSVMALAGMICALVLNAGYGLWLALCSGIFVGIAVGLANGLMVTLIGLSPFIATLASLSMVRGLTYGIVQGELITPPDSPAARMFSALGNGKVWLIPAPVILMVALALVLMVVLNWTPFGRRVYAIGGNEAAARLLGLKVDRLKVILYVISGALAAVGGMLLTAKAGSALPDAALGYELDVIAAIIIGGVSLSGGSGTIPGILIGAALLGVINNGIVLTGLAGYWQQFITGLVIAAAATLDRARKRLQARRRL